MINAVSNKEVFILSYSWQFYAYGITVSADLLWNFKKRVDVAGPTEQTLNHNEDGHDDDRRYETIDGLARK